MSYSLATAAASAGINKSTVFRAIKGGRISAQRDDNGQWQIDPAEFHRVFPPLPAGATTGQQPAQQGAITDALVATLNKVIDDLRADRDHWRTAFENAQRQIPAQPQQYAPPPATPVTAPPVKKRRRYRLGWVRGGWFGRPAA